MSRESGTKHLWPNRQRCLACRRFFGLTVIQGLYCSIRCASEPDATEDVMAAPRECVVRPRRGTPQHFKHRYVSLAEIPEGRLMHPGDSVYRCGNCGALHIGHRRAALAMYLD